MVPTPSEPLVDSVNDAAVRLGPSRTRLNELMATGQLRSIKVGKRRLILATLSASCSKPVSRLIIPKLKPPPRVGGEAAVSIPARFEFAYNVLYLRPFLKAADHNSIVRLDLLTCNDPSPSLQPVTIGKAVGDE